MRDDAVDLWALDEVHFQQQGSRCRMWVSPETRDPIVYHHPTRKSVGYFAAVRLRDGEFLFRRETGRFNGESFWEFLKLFREASSVSAVAYSPSVTMRSIIAPHSICLGVINKLHNFAWTSCLPIAWNSTLSNGSGSARAGCICTIVTSDSSMESFAPWKISLPNGQSPTISCADYAQLLRTLCLIPATRKPFTSRSCAVENPRSTRPLACGLCAGIQAICNSCKARPIWVGGKSIGSFCTPGSSRLTF